MRLSDQPSKRQLVNMLFKGASILLAPEVEHPARVLNGHRV